ncbi:MAG: electron transport complex subunit RsxC [Lachnospiraceae bacterium]|jgi:electron transport complex protein RnfC|nr:electron transport complex subunit RsxC [Lachnospiraceae bacterium]
MAGQTFYGGIRPYSGKDLSKYRPIRTVLPKEPLLVYPLLQSMGDPAVPVVEPGEHILTGQLIARAESELSANLHSSVSGTVYAIEEHAVVGGERQKSILVQNDGRFDEIQYPSSRRYSSMSADEIIRAVWEAGVVGMGGAGLPTHIKYNIEKRNRIDYCIANCVECEPYLTSDYRRMLETPAKLINGLRILLHIFPRARGIIALDEEKADLYRLFRKMLKDDTRIYVKKLQSKFPLGSERQLIYALTGRTLNAMMLPRDIGCIVNNVDTLVAVNQAVMVYEPLITRLITVTGDAIVHPQNFRVRIGMSYNELIERAGGFRQRPALLLDGGTMTGTKITDTNVPITKLSSAVVALRKDRVSDRRETACTRCARCVLVCPNHLVPVQLHKDVAAGNVDAFIAHNGLECSDCGCCSYSCPSRIGLSLAISDMRKKILTEQPEKAGDYLRRYIRR